MKITTLIENTTMNPDLASEHGLSLLIQQDGKSYLLDSGETGAFFDNAQKMGFDLSDIEFSVLSHGHYDHAGGFYRLPQADIQKKLYLMEDAEKDYYSCSKNHFHSVSIPKAVLEACKEQLVFIPKAKSKTKLAPGIYALPHTTKGLEAIGMRAKLYKKHPDLKTEPETAEEVMPDDFSHEMSLVFDTPKGLVIFNSCSHGGMRAIISEVREAFPDKKCYAFVGGLHMQTFDEGKPGCTFTEEEVKSLADFFKESGLEAVYTGHCTGEVGFAMLDKHMNGLLHALTTGQTFEL